MENSEEMLSNQKKIIDNQEEILKNQATIIHNQESLLDNQSSITGNQEVIVHNQSSIISNQKQIVDNQVTLSVISQTQAHLLNLVRKIAGQEESHEKTVQFLENLKIETEASVKAKDLAEPETNLESSK
jgi:hypothetical protein